MVDFRYCEYKCKYLDNKKCIKDLCFADIGQQGSINNSTFITYFMDKEQNELNYVFISRSEMIDYLNEVTQLLGCHLCLIQETSKYYRIQIEIPGNDKRYLIYVSTIVRYIYEHPFSIAVYCAMKNRYSFPELNIIQIVQFYIGAFCDKRPCHHFGDATYTFSNINVKCQFNLIKNFFNDCCVEKFVKLTSTHTSILNDIQVFPIKILPQISDCINDLANIVYEKNKKRICCW